MKQTNQLVSINSKILYNFTCFLSFLFSHFLCATKNKNKEIAIFANSNEIFATHKHTHLNQSYVIPNRFSVQICCLLK